MSYYDAKAMRARADRLLTCGFECFSEPEAPENLQKLQEELRHAEFEFQVYCRGAKRLAVKEGDSYTPSAPDVCNELRQLVANEPLAGDWNDTWEAALARWMAAPPTKGHHVCPVVVLREKKVVVPKGTPASPPPHEDSPPGEIDRTNVWLLSKADAGSRFFVLDYSGMFELKSDDVAFSGHDYVPPDGIFKPDWLYRQARSFMSALEFGGGAGVRINPWRAMELLPSLLPDAEKIRSQPQWRALFRVVRACAEIECYAHMDVLQGYDSSNISIPLVHYAGPTSKDLGGNSELGGFIASLRVHDEPLLGRFEDFGLIASRQGWKDAVPWGKAYECFSGSEGDDFAGTVISEAGISSAVPKPSPKQRRFWRHPHSHYRVAMLCRSEPALRAVMWRMAVHRLRNLAWYPVDQMKIPDELKKRGRLGLILTSEMAFTIAARLHVFRPKRAIGDWMSEAITAAWESSRSDGLTPAQRHAAFENRFSDQQLSPTTTDTLLIDSSMYKLAHWPADKKHPYPTRLAPVDLYPEGSAPAVLPKLDRTPRTSPFFDGGDFIDPVIPSEWRVEAKAADGHFTAGAGRKIADPERKSEVSRDAYSKAFASFGLNLQLPVGHSSPQPAKVHEDPLFRQCTREALAALTAAQILIDGQPQANSSLVQERPVSNPSLRWTSLQLWAMRERKVASALRVGTDPAKPPVSQDSRWQLFADDLRGKTLYVFDQRHSVAAQPHELASTDAATGKVSSLGAAPSCVIGSDSAVNFGVDVGRPLALQSFEVFVSAMVDGLGLRSADEFVVSQKGKDFTLQLAWLRQSFPVQGGEASASELAFYLEYLGFRHSAFDGPGWSGGPLGKHLFSLGLDLWGRTTQAEEFFHQDWPAKAFPTVPKGKPRRLAPSDLDLTTTLRLWNPDLGESRTSSTALAAALLSWPSLHRLRDMLRTEPQARRALYDVWRMGMRGVLNLPVEAPQTLVSKAPAVYQLFQTPETFAALAYWRLVDLPGLRAALKAASFRSLSAKWVSDGKGDADLSRWKSEHRRSYFRDALVASLSDGDLKSRLLMLAREPAGVDDVPYEADPNKVFDFDGLPPSSPYRPAPSAQVMMIPVGGSGVRVGVLASAPSAAVAGGPPSAAAIAAIVAAAPSVTPATVSVYTVSGLVLALPGGEAVPFLLPEPVEVAFSSSAPAAGQLKLHWTPDSQELVDVVEAQPDAEFRLSVDASSWLGPLVDDLALTLFIEAQQRDVGLEMVAGLELSSPWLREPIALRTPIAKVTGLTLAARELVWSVPLSDLAHDLEQVLPFRLDASAQLQIAVGLDAALAPTVRLSLQASSMRLLLGSPAAALKLAGETPLRIDVDLVRRKARIELPAELALSLEMQLAMQTADGTTRIVPMSRQDQDAAITIDLGRVKVPVLATGAIETAESAAALASASASALHIGIEETGLPRIPVALLVAGMPTLQAATSQLMDVADEWLGGAKAFLTELRMEGANAVSVVADAARFGFAFDATLVAGPMEAAMHLTCTCPLDGDVLDLVKGFSFALSDAEIEFDMKGGKALSLGAMARLDLPSRLRARLDFSGVGDFIQLIIEPTAPLQLHVPAQDGFVFNIDALALGRGGLSLHAIVREGSVSLPGLPSLDANLVVEGARQDMGELTIRQGRLTAASLRARTRLQLFDDADGVLSVRMLADASGLSVLAELDAGVNRVFRIRVLCLQVQVQSVQLGLSWNERQGWAAHGGLTGSASFDPEGELSGRLAEYYELFDGTSVHFEHLDLRDLGKAAVRVQVTPRKFKVASILEVVWRGIVFNAPHPVTGLRSVLLLGEVTFKADFPSLQAELSLGDITVSQRDAHSLLPQVRISSLGIKLRVDGGFRFAGSIREYDDDREFGLGGTVSLESSFLPAADLMLKLTRVNDGGEQLPSIAVYGEIQRDDHLGYGFFLRRVGIGAGVRQGLRGFSDPPLAGKPWPTIAQRVQEAVKSPLGLPYPGDPESWIPLPPSLGGPQYLLTGYGLVSFGLFAMDKDHPFVGSMVLAIDERLSIVAGINAWFLASPEAAKTDLFLKNPAMRGAVGFSPREQRLYGHFITMKDPRFGPTAEGNALGDLLRRALDSTRLTASLFADAHGAIVEVGWPRQAKFEAELGPARGSVEAGFRFGYYRGTHALGLNLKAQAELSGGFSGDLGFANVSVSAKASFELVASFGGAITSSGQLYAIAQLTVAAALELSVHVWKRLKISTFWRTYEITLFDVGASVSVTVSASLSAALVPGGVGFEGMATVGLHVAGFGFDVNVRVAASEGRISEARRVISELMPPIDDLINAGKQLRLAASSSSALTTMAMVAPAALSMGATSAPTLGLPPAPTRWRYFPVRVGDELRVVLFPDGDMGAVYPRPEALGEGFVARRHGWSWTQEAGAVWLGLVGRTDEIGDRKSFDADDGANGVLLPLEWMQVEVPDYGKAYLIGDELQTLETILPDYQEIVDPRTQRPVPGDFDDPAVSAAPTRRSTRFRIRRTEGSYDWHLENAARWSQARSRTDRPAETQQGELLLQLLALARDTAATAKQDVPPLNAKGEPEGRRLAAQLGLVLAFSDPQRVLESALKVSGLKALFKEGSLRLLGQAIGLDDVVPPVNVGDRYQIVPGHAFQSNGEVGLTWTVLRVRADGKEVRRQGSHAGIEHFRVQRVQAGGSTSLPAQAPILLRPSWVNYRDAGNRGFAVRPQFQHLDRGLPTALGLDATLEYRVEALSPAGELLAVQVIRAPYKPVSQPYAVRHAQVLLRLRSTPSAATAHTLRFDVAVSVPKEVSDAQAAALHKRLRVFRRDAKAGVLGRYGDGLDLALDVVTEPAVKDAEGVTVELAQPAQMRQLAAEELQQLAPVTLQWERLGKLADGLQHFTASLSVEPGTEQPDWDRVLGVGAQAGEFHCFVAGELSVGELDSSAMKLRHAVSFEARQTPPGPLPMPTQPEDGMFSEGSEVALIERVPIVASALTAREVLPLSAAVFHPEVVRGSFEAAGGRPGHAAVRLRGILTLPTTLDSRLGPIVALKVFAKDEMDVVLPARQLAHLSLQPESVFRALPSSVTPRGKPDAPGGLDWRPETDRLVASWQDPVTPPTAKSTARMGAQVDASGRRVMLHEDLIQVLGKLDVIAEQFGGVATVRFSVDEPLVPSGVATLPGERSEQLLKRADAIADPAGWRLVEALGGSLSCWIECDGDCLDPDVWLGELNDAGARNPPDPVAAIMFTRFAPGQRPHGKVRLQWAVRLFAWSVLTEMDGLRLGKAHKEVLASGHLLEALRLLDFHEYDPEKAVMVPAPWQKLLDALGDRSESFLRDAHQDDRPVSRRRLFWQAPLHSGGEVDSDAAPAEAAMLEGEVHLFHPLGEDFARKLTVHVEVLRRYAFRSEGEPDPGAKKVASHAVRVPRTLPLSQDLWGVGADAQTGSFTALVGVHPAQLAPMSRADLQPRKQFIRQRTDLLWRVASSDALDWRRMIQKVSDFDPEEWQRSWALPDGEPSSLDDWKLPKRNDVRISRGFNRFRYPHLPAAYRYSVAVTTQAGVRESAEPAESGALLRQRESDRWLAPMFVESGDLRYAGPTLVTDLAEDGWLQFEFPLVRAVDSLDPASWPPGESRRVKGVRTHWLRNDKPLDTGEENDASDGEEASAPQGVELMPMQLPDVRAAYVIVARQVGSGGRSEVVELLRFATPHELEGGAKAQLTVAPYTVVDASIGQIAGGALAGRLCGRCRVNVSLPEFAWLGDVRDDASPWQLSVLVERDGIRFGGQA